MAADRDRSVGRRISSFFSTSSTNLANNPASKNEKPLPHDPPFSARPVSRGRQPDANKLRKSSAPSPQISAHHTPAGSLDLPPPFGRPSARGSVDSTAGLPRAPFAASSNSSRDASPHTRSRDPSPKPFFLRPQAASSNPSLPQYNPPAGLKPLPGPAEGPTKLVSKRKSWMPTLNNKDKDKDRRQSEPTRSVPLPLAWIAGHNETIGYNVGPLTSGQVLPELWDDNGDTFVHLFPQSTGRGASFRVHSSIYASSATLMELAFGDWFVEHASYQEPSVPSISEEGPASTDTSAPRKDTIPSERPKEAHLYVPILSGGALSSAAKAAKISDDQITREDIDALIAVRNMFAFLVGQSLIATEARPTIFEVFIKVADSLATYGFSNMDGSTYGEVATASFDSYIEELELADVRYSREKCIEAVLLSERMRSVALFNEAFTHAAGKYGELMDARETFASAAAKYDRISSVTRARLERASIDLDLRQHGVEVRLGGFEFKSIFSGILNSRTADERKQVRFNALRTQFLAVKKHVVGYYKDRFGSWPPKASRKKNNLGRSGLNRTVLRALYQDFSDLYDLYADRSTVTPRTNNAYLPDSDDDLTAGEEPIARVLWRVFDEYDRATPPVQPPIPFDLPILPSAPDQFASTGNANKDEKLRQKKLREEESARLLAGSRNRDAEARIKTSPFLQSMMVFETKTAKNATLSQLIDNRVGTWIFCYAVIQALPLLVIDAPAVQFSKGVEYFLCEPPRHGVPWANPEATGRGRVARSWYGVSGGGGVVSLPSDLIEHGTEGIYRRSHCWQRAVQWSRALGLDTSTVTSGSTEHRFPTDYNLGMKRTRDTEEATRKGSLGGTATLAPPVAPGSRPGSSHGSPGTPRAISQERRSSALGLGLETLALPPGVAPRGAAGATLSPATPFSGRDPSRSRPGTRDGLSATPNTASTSTAKSFDTILAEMEAEKVKGKGGKKKK